MFIFLRLLLAHFIGDFPLQIGSVYSAKVKNWKGKLIHALIIAFAMILCTWPLWGSPWLWLLILFVTAAHFLQDWAKLVILQRMKNSNNFFVFMGDQILHIATLLLVWLTPLAKHTPKSLDNTLSKIYFNDQAVLTLTTVLLVSFAGTFILATFKETFLPKRFYTPHLDPLERYYGLLERTLMLGLLMKSPVLIFALPLFIIPKFLYTIHQIKRLKGSSFEPFLIDTILGMLLVLVAYGIYRAAI